MNKKVVFLPYDMDTAIGINNEGALVFGYGLEDTDTVGGAEVFNGQSSVLWTNLRETFGPEIKQMYQTLRAGGNFSYAAVEQAFEEHQAKWPEAVFNEDAFFKYIMPLIEDNDDTYLTMLLGSKAEQRKWWLYNRFRYMDSKYNAGDALTDRIILRGNAKANIVLTPYADLYASIRWGSTLKQIRATKNTPVTMVNPLDSLGDTDIYVYSAGQVSDLGDLSGLMVSFADFHSGIRLRSIVLGSTAANYSNVALRSISLGNLKLLRKIDARNCTNLGTANENYAAQKNIDLSGCNSIEEVYFDGTNIGSVTLPNGGILKKLHLPGTITNLTIRNQTQLTEFVCPDFSNVTTLNLENTPSVVNISSIIDDVAAGCRVRLFNFYWNFESIAAANAFLAKFEGLTGIDQNGVNKPTPQIYATIHVPSCTGDDIDAIHENFPDITVEADVASYYLRYYNWEGDTLLYTETVQKNQNGSWATQPTHEQTAQYTFAFAGWSSRRNATAAEANCRNSIQANTNVYAAYTTTIRTYTVTFKNSNGTVLKTVNDVPYGGTATPPSDPSHPTDPSTYQFTGWNPTGANITGNTECVAQYRDTSSPLLKYLAGTLVNYTSQSNVIGQYAFYQMSSLKTVDFAGSGNVSVGSSAFSSVTLNSITISSNTKASLASGVGLPQTVYADNGFIYVPANLIESYKADASWAGINFVAIGSTAGTDFSTISESWAQIKAAIDDESFFSSAYTVGDKKKLTYGTHNVYMEIRKIDTANKFVDFVVKNFDESITMGSAMAAYADTNAYSRLSTIYNDELPSDVKAAITSVTKKYYNYQGNTDEVAVPLWLLNTKDAGLTGSYLKDSEGENYFASDAQRIKRQASNGSTGNWWLGSAYSSSVFMCVSGGGYAGSYGPNGSCGLVFGFRIQKS